MLIKMLCTIKGTEDGFIVRQFKEGETYDIRESLARLFLSNKEAIKVIDNPINKN